MFSTALIPVNFRESLPRLRGLISFLENFGTSRVILLHVASGHQRDRWQTSLEQLRDQLQDALESSGLACDVQVSGGSAPSEVCRVAREEPVDFIALPWKRKNWLQRTLVGSFSKDVIRLSDLPVFLYKEGIYSRRSESSREAFVVLYATALQRQDEYVLPLLSWPRLKVDRLVLVHAGPRAPDPVAEHHRDQDVSRRLGALARSCDIPGCLVDTRSVTGNARREILRIARHEGARLLVVGKSEKQGSLAEMVGSVAEAVAYNAGQSVLIAGQFIAGDLGTSAASAHQVDSGDPGQPGEPENRLTPKREEGHA
ncbi:Nucleotide-binding universal stress protein, UspA family [Alkalispirochaeta americana]|uniref:Nucleotide-binding universal stress protein, UspA family n=1 Tax=Alkalispirochaeta americana TaxID=159291 RepID=A0A1N6WCH0_9SPIO|nr:universal stress protein [Alkalispirochaeta americana]SIQ87722.1 Nucleotide-binding universal stress protein, UspA family [Alkalispirochaeta americana]